MTAPAPKRPRLRGHTAIRVGAILAAAGLAVLIAGIIVIATQTLSKVDSFQRVSFRAGTGVVSFTRTGNYVAYYEAPSVTSSISEVPGIEVALRNQASGADVQLQRYGNNPNGKIDRLTYSYHGHHGVAVLQFHIDTPGKYDAAVRASSAADPNGDIAFGPSIKTGTIVGGGLSALGALLLLAGVIVLIVGLVRRRNHKKELQTLYGAQPVPGYPPSGYPPQGGYPPQQGGYPPQQGGYSPAYPPPAPPPGYTPPGYPPPSYPAPSGPPSSGPPSSGPPSSGPPSSGSQPSEPPPSEPWPPKE
jgi:hypothetical protein